MRSRLFNFIAHIASTHPRKIVAASLALTIAAGVYAAVTLRLNANLDELVSEKLDYHRRYLDFLEEFGDEEYLYIVVDAAGDMRRAKDFVEKLGQRLKSLPDVKEVIWRIENPALEKNFLLYLTPKQLAALGAMTSEGPFAVKNIADWDGMERLLGALATRIGRPVSPDEEAELTQGFTFIDGLLDDMAKALQEGKAYRSRLQELFFGDGETFDPDGFYRNGDLLFVLIMPSKDFTTMEVIARPLAAIRQTIEEVKAEFPGIDAGLTGRPVLAADEIAASDTDMRRATGLAIALVGILFVLFFRSVSRPVLAMVSLVMGIAWTFGLVAIIFGMLNILSIVFALILIGAAVEYAIHLVARYQEELAADGDIEGAMARALSTSGRADLTSAFTTAAAFLTIMWTDFTALAELGFIAASGILLCLVSMLVVLPAMIVLRDRRRTPRELKLIRPFELPRIGIVYRRPALLFLLAMGIVIASVPFASHIGFDNNLLNLQPEGLESVKYEHLILAKSDETTWFARAVSDSIPESHAKAIALSKLSSVRSVDDIGRILPEDQEAKILAIRGMAPAFRGISFGEVGDRIDARRLMFELGRLASGLGRLQEQAFSAGRTDAVEGLESFSAKVQRLALLVDSSDEGQLQDLGKFQREFFADLHKHLTILSGGIDPKPIELADLPEDLVGRFVSPKGRYALFIYPRENIWDPGALARFVDEIREVDPLALGTPIEVHESGRIMRRTFAQSAALAFIVICVLVWIDFRSWRATILAVMPLAVGTLWLLGFMGFTGIQFNMANFFAIPILIGIGVDFGVHLVHRLRQERSLSAIGTSTGKAVLLTALANAVGFGAMMIASHRGIASLGKVMAVGALGCLAAALFAMPPVAKFLKYGRNS